MVIRVDRVFLAWSAATADCSVFEWAAERRHIASLQLRVLLKVSDMAMFVDELCNLREAGQGLRRAAWPKGRYLRLVNGAPFGYVLIEQIGFEEFNLGGWRPTQSDLAACDWYLALRHTV